MRLTDDLVRLSRRRAELEAAIRKPGGIRITAERELIMLRQSLVGTHDRAPVAHEIAGGGKPAHNTQAHKDRY